MEQQTILIFGVTFDQLWESTEVYRWIRTQSFKTIIFCFNGVHNTWKYIMYSY